MAADIFLRHTARHYANGALTQEPMDVGGLACTLVGRWPSIETQVQQARALWDRERGRLLGPRRLRVRREFAREPLLIV